MSLGLGLIKGYLDGHQDIKRRLNVNLIGNDGINFYSEDEPLSLDFSNIKIVFINTRIIVITHDGEVFQRINSEWIRQDISNIVDGEIFGEFLALIDKSSAFHISNVLTGKTLETKEKVLSISTTITGFHITYKDKEEELNFSTTKSITFPSSKVKLLGLKDKVILPGDGFYLSIFKEDQYLSTAK